MNARIYLLLDIEDNDCSLVMRRLVGRAGVTAVERLEGKPNVILSMEASDKHALAELMMPLLESIEDYTQDLQLLISKESSARVLNRL